MNLTRVNDITTLISDMVHILYHDIICMHVSESLFISHMPIIIQDRTLNIITDCMINNYWIHSTVMHAYYYNCTVCWPLHVEWNHQS